jgi:hypothetical protein
MPNTFARISLLAILVASGRPAAGQQTATPQPLASMRLPPVNALSARPNAGEALAATGPATEPSRIFLIGHPTRIASNGPSSLTERLRLDAAPEGHRTRHAVIGGVLGAAAGAITCTVISNMVKDSGTGFSTCDTKAYVAFGLGGLGVGALIGALVK